MLNQPRWLHSRKYTHIIDRHHDLAHIFLSLQFLFISVSGDFKLLGYYSINTDQNICGMQRMFNILHSRKKIVYLLILLSSFQAFEAFWFYAIGSIYLVEGWSQRCSCVTFWLCFSQKITKFPQCSTMRLLATRICCRLKSNFINEVSVACL